MEQIIMQYFKWLWLFLVFLFLGWGIYKSCREDMEFRAYKKKKKRFHQFDESRRRK
jgi:hypothetical protein